MHVQLAKYEGLGNDFIVVEVDPAASSALGPEQVVALCDRHRGVGADGVLLVRVHGGRPRMDVINADGSVPEMCGNGIRCVALHLARTGRVHGGEVVIDTAAGPHRCRVLRDGDDGEIEVEMRPFSLQPAEIGLRAEAPLVDAPFAVGDATLRVTAVSMGNPHVVTFDAVGERAGELGPLLGKHARFASGVNAGFARMQGARQMELRVFERGAGWTEACGTGACAAAVAAVETGRSARGEPLRVELPGGALTIVVHEPGQPVRMTGPARFVFEGRAVL